MFFFVCFFVFFVLFFLPICIGEKLGKGSLFGATKVARGYKEGASGEDRLPPIGHIVFVVHGIGQNMDISSIEKSSSE